MSIDNSPWNPMEKAIDIKHMGKLGEELCKAGAAAFRCIIQGIDECEPETGKPNSERLEDKLADVSANMDLVIDHFKLNAERISDRSKMKKKRLHIWHQSLEEYSQKDNSSANKNWISESYKSWSFWLSVAIILFMFLMTYLGDILGTTHH